MGRKKYERTVAEDDYRMHVEYSARMNHRFGTSFAGLPYDDPIINSDGMLLELFVLKETPGERIDAAVRQAKSERDVVKVQVTQCEESWLVNAGMPPHALETMKAPVPDPNARILFLLPEFGGFYESIHTDACDDAESLLFQTNEGEEIPLADREWKIDYSKVYPQYCREFVDALKSYLDDKNEFPVESMRFEELRMPRERNFQTDEVICSISQDEFERIFGADTAAQASTAGAEFLGELLNAKSGGWEDIQVLDHADPWSEKVSAAIDKGLVPNAAVEPAEPQEEEDGLSP